MQRGKQTGMSLITALAFTVVVGTVLAGVATVATSHYGRAELEGDYANAVALADAGLNFELMHISRDTSDPSRAHQEGSPFVGSISGVPGTFTVFVRDWNGGACDTGPFAPPEPEVCIVSTGTVNGVARTVIARGEKKSLFDEYAIYAIKDGEFNGGGMSDGSTRVVGNMGTNGELDYNGALGTNIVEGVIGLNGPDAGSSDSGNNIVASPDPVQFPTVEEIANSLFPGGLSYLVNNNSNGSIRRLNSSDTALASEPTIVNITRADVETKLAGTIYTTSSRTFKDPNPSQAPESTSSLDAAGTGSRFVMPADVEHGTPALGIQGKKTYFLPPGDYYFNSLQFTSGSVALVMLTHLCGQDGYSSQLRIWVDGNGGNDRIQSDIIFTDPNPNKFRLYYNKCSTLNIAGNSQFRGGLYGVKDGCNADLPAFDFAGNSRVYGSVISNSFRVSGSTKIIFPNNGGGSSPDDFPLWYGLGNGWKEIPVVSGRPVFVDGTSK